MEEFLKKIDKSQYPKTARKWAWSAVFIFPVFVIVNKLWPFLYIYITLNLINFSLLLLGVDRYILDLVSVITYAIFLFFTFYLLLYGRILVWRKLGYSEKDIPSFKLRQRIVLYINILLLGSIFISIIYFLNIARLNI